jgi:hypothetical protein
MEKKVIPRQQGVRVAYAPCLIYYIETGRYFQARGRPDGKNAGLLSLRSEAFFMYNGHD